MPGRRGFDVLHRVDLDDQLVQFHHLARIEPDVAIMVHVAVALAGDLDRNIGVDLLVGRLDGTALAGFALDDADDLEIVAADAQHFAERRLGGQQPAGAVLGEHDDAAWAAASRGVMTRPAMTSRRTRSNQSGVVPTTRMSSLRSPSRPSLRMSFTGTVRRTIASESLARAFVLVEQAVDAHADGERCRVTPPPRALST